MQFRTYGAVLTTAFLLALPSVGAAQSDVTFKVDLNLTRVAADIETVQVYCELTSAALNTRGGKGSEKLVRGSTNVPVTGGQVVTTATVVMPITPDILVNPVGQSAHWACNLSGYSKSLKTWDVFDSKSPKFAYQLSPTPPKSEGDFNW